MKYRHMTPDEAKRIAMVIFLAIFVAEALCAYRLINQRAVIEGYLVLSTWCKDMIHAVLERLGVFDKLLGLRIFNLRE